MMELLSWATVLAVLAGVAATAAALKGLPVIWGALKVAVSSISKFFHASDAISEVGQAVKKLSSDLQAHMLEEERMRREEKDMVQQLVDTVNDFASVADRQTLEVAEAVFKQATFNEDIAYYIVDWENEEWMWQWGNPSYLRLTGLTVAQARSGQYWDIIGDDEKERVFSAATYAGEHGIPLEVDFTNVNVCTGEKTPVRVVAAPLKNRAEETVAYLGAIHVRPGLEE